MFVLSCAAPPDTRGDRPLVVGLSADIDSWNPYTSNEATAASVLEMLYPRLVREWGEGEAATRFTPWLAESWEFSDDRLALTFRLRDDASWTNGSPVTCRDVQFTHSIQVDDRLAWSGAFLKERIAVVDCIDERTVVFRYTMPYADQLIDANDDAIVPAAYGEVPLEEWAGTAWEDRFVGCGPFRLGAVRPAQEAVLLRNESWWDAAAVSLPSVVLRVHADSSAAAQRLLDGEVDMVPKLPALRAAEVAADADLRVVELASLAFTYLGWNALEPGAYREDRAARGCDASDGCAETAGDIRRLQRDRPHPALADARVRRALSAAIDREDIVRGVWAGKARVGSTPIVTAQWAHVDDAGLEFSPSRSNEWLDAAGWIDRDGDGVREKDGWPLELRVIVNEDNRVRRDAVARAVNALREVGVAVSVEALPRAEFVQRARAKDFDAIVSGWWAGTRIEPQNMLHTDAAVERGNNLTAWSTAESDALMDRALGAASPDEAQPLWTEWQLLYAREQPLTVLYEETRLLGLSRRVEGPPPSFLNPFQVLHLWSLH